MALAPPSKRPIINGEKECVKCGLFRPLKDYGHRTRKGTMSYSAVCQRCTNLAAFFNMSASQYDEMLQTQGGGCAICGATGPGNSWYKYFAIDHDHQTGKVRGLLCQTCNTGLGAFRDDIVLLDRAVEYLQRDYSTAHEVPEHRRQVTSGKPSKYVRESAKLPIAVQARLFDDAA